MITSDFRVNIPSYLTPAQVQATVEQALALADGVIPAEPTDFLCTQFAALTEVNNVLGVAIGTHQVANPFTEARQDADAKRDNGFRRFRNAVRDVERDNEETEAALVAAAQTLGQILDEHPSDLASMPLDDNTTELNQLLPKLQAEPAASAVTELGLGRFVTRMQDANDAYKQAVQDALEANEDRAAPQDWEAVRPVRWLGSVFLSNLAFLGLSNAGVQSVSTQINDLLASAVAIARARQTRNENDGDGTDGESGSGESETSSEV